jgi:predicted Fe-Mo cluster-binding NifX family protein
MKIAVTATEPNLDAQVDPRFGRCRHFLIVETDDLSFEAVENPNMALGGGAGIQSAQLIAEKGVGAVLTGNCGPNAYHTLSAAGLQVVIGASGTVREVVDQFKSGAFAAASGANVQSHFGMGTTPGMGMGRGIGMGRGMGSGMMAGPMAAGQGAAPTKEQELEMLKTQAQSMQQQMDQIMASIKELE